jgi:membrane associated rhomboid family serine protease
MPLCPDCRTELATIRQREGLFYRCHSCQGRAVTLPQIRRTAGDRFVTALLRQINTNAQMGGRQCPFCTRGMRHFESQNPRLELDACKACGSVWFDPQEFEAVPANAPVAAEELHLRAREVIAVEQVRQIGERAAQEAEPDELWKTIPALFGFPVETGVAPPARRPWLTWSVAALIVAISLAAFSNLGTAVARFGFIPSEAWRWGGLTSLTSFFLHADLWHLVGNLYFLLIFGDNVEDFLGRRRTLLLLLVATLVGDGVHALAQPGSTTPCVGASGGISGIIAFYALQFPRARLGFLFRYYVHFRWLQIPAWGALVLWLGVQSLGVSLELSGHSHVAATAHLGGAFIGFIAWLFWQKLQVAGVEDYQRTSAR